MWLQWRDQARANSEVRNERLRAVLGFEKSMTFQGTDSQRFNDLNRSTHQVKQVVHYIRLSKHIGGSNESSQATKT
jgi:hypothetical protein